MPPRPRAGVLIRPAHDARGRPVTSNPRPRRRADQGAVILTLDRHPPMTPAQHLDTLAATSHRLSPNLARRRRLRRRRRPPEWRRSLRSAPSPNPLPWGRSFRRGPRRLRPRRGEEASPDFIRSPGEGCASNNAAPSEHNLKDALPSYHPAAPQHPPATAAPQRLTRPPRHGTLRAVKPARSAGPGHMRGNTPVTRASHSPHTGRRDRIS